MARYGYLTKKYFVLIYRQFPKHGFDNKAEEFPESTRFNELKKILSYRLFWKCKI